MCLSTTPAFASSIPVRLASRVASRTPAFLVTPSTPPRKPSVPKRPSAPRMIVNEAKGGRVLHVKASPDGRVGDCPFSIKANMALRFRGVEFQVSCVDTSNKPQWFLDLTEKATTPVFVDGDRVLNDSADIVQAADEMGTGPTLIRKSDPNWDKASQVIEPIFSKFISLMKNKDDNEEQKCKDQVVDSVKSLSAYIKSVDGPFLLGRQVSALDCDLAPKAKNVLVAAPHYKNVEFPDDCEPLKEYISHIETLDEWKLSTPSDELFVSAWQKFFE